MVNALKSIDTIGIHLRCLLLETYSRLFSRVFATLLPFGLTAAQLLLIVRDRDRRNAIGIL